jgi:uncharacterized RDD family membrane protein YckC
MKNRFLDALLKFIIISAVFHIILLIIFSIVTSDIIPLNYFNILELDLFFPNIIKGTLSQALSVVVMIVIYVLIYLFFTKKKKIEDV